MGRNVRSNRSWRILFIAILGTVLVACAPRVATRGNSADEERLAQIEPGRHGRVETLDEPVLDRGEQFGGFGCFALGMPEVDQAVGRLGGEDQLIALRASSRSS